MKKAGIIGASGYAGIELIKLLEKHGGVKILFANSRAYEGMSAKELDPCVKSGLKFTNHSIDEINAMMPDIVFVATPEQASKEIVPKLKTRAIDLSYNYRFSRKAVYGLPELFRERIRTAGIVANPGCYATAALLALLPMKDCSKYAILDCKSGYSGAGREKKYVNDPDNYTDNIIAYNITRHKHVPEIQQFLKMKISFTPHVIPTFRGIMCTAHIMLKKKMNENAVKKLYAEQYKDEPFVRISDSLPEIREVQNTNYCSIGGFDVDSSNRLVVISTIDNLLKGASGQAVQNMNIMLGFPESQGLE